MSAETVTVFTHHSGAWHPAAELEVFSPTSGRKSRTRLGYRNDYLTKNIDSFGAIDQHAVSARFPLGFDTWTFESWPPFLLDIVPSGAARRWLEKRLSHEFQTEQELDWILLRNHSVGPIGHLKIDGGAAPQQGPGDLERRGFTREEVIERDYEFLEYAAAHGAAIGGATGAGGDAPKILLAEDSRGLLHPAETLPDEETSRCWFVKWPRGEAKLADRMVLEIEHHYAHALAELGVDTCPGDLEEGPKPSLWIPRFDRIVRRNEVDRIAVESLYSLAGILRMGARVNHQSFLAALRGTLDRAGQNNTIEMVREYLRRELLDVIVGNSDNHGRNRAIVRGDTVEWSPVYDLAPMVMDPAMITRSTVWEHHEFGGRIDWLGICAELDGWLPGLEAHDTLFEFGARLLPLKEMLADRGVDSAFLTRPGIYIGRLESALHQWGLR